MTSSNTFQSDIGSFQNGGHGEDIIKAPLGIIYVLICQYFVSTDRPTDRPTHFHEREREGDGKQNILWGWPKPSQIWTKWKSKLIHIASRLYL